MATITGSEVLAQALRSQGVDTMFYLMGGPMLETEAACIKLGIRAIDHLPVAAGRERPRLAVRRAGAR